MPTPKLLPLLLALATAPALGETLGDIHALALDNDPAWRAALERHAVAVEGQTQARAGMLPNLTGTAFDAEHSGDADYGVTGWTLTLTQPLYRKERYSAWKQAGHAATAAGAQLEAERLGLIVRSTQRYFDALAAGDNLEFARREKAANARQLEQTEQRFKVGLIAITDVHEARARHDQAVAQEIGAESQLAIAREALRELTGSAPGELRPLGSELPLALPDPADVEAWVARALEQSPAVLAAREALAGATQGLERSRAGHYPSIDLIAAQSSTDSDATGTAVTTDDTELRVQLTLPIYAGGGTQAQVRAARHQADEARANLEAARRSTERLVRSSYLGVQTNISEVRAFEQALVSSESALKATEAGFQVGTRTSVDVLDAQRQLYRARRDLARARYDYVVNGLRLRQAAGTLADADLATVNRWLQ